jgi:hypothetical protein
VPNLIRRGRVRPLILAAAIGGALLVQAAPVAALDSRYPDAEQRYAELLACTRAGGWVRVNGSCDRVDTANRVPSRRAFSVSARLSNQVARPHARRLARAGYLSHDLGGSIRQRFARAGMANGSFGENIGYAYGDPVEAVVQIHRLFQAEWRSKGWHWKAMTDKTYRKVGIGVWVRNGLTYLSVDFHS